MDCRTGQTLYRTRALAMGSAIWADGRLYVLSQSGDVALLEPTPEGFQFHGRFRLVERPCFSPAMAIILSSGSRRSRR